MTIAEVEEIIEMFARGAKWAELAGFRGVQVHAAHGYLLAQFLSPKSNLRDDEFGGSAIRRAEIVRRILRRVRDVTAKGFCVGIKLNSADVGDDTAWKETLEQIRVIIDAGVDFIEISGGSYENPLMVQEPEENEPKVAVSERTAERESFFLHFAQTIRSCFPSTVLMVTGGFRTRLGMEAALNSGACDLIGMGRPTAVLPRLAKEIILNPEVKDKDASVRLKKLEVPWYAEWLGKKPIGAGQQSEYYAGQIRRMGRGEKPIDTRL
jgi:2,4-dienoyl-CoA reductase-like NADH-dependent reductase (Old Yellow Enzyme family)